MSGEAESANEGIVKMYTSVKKKKVNILQDFYFKGRTKTPSFKTAKNLLTVTLGKMPRRI